MQPTYLPWPGYFALMAEVDTFVFLDDVQCERQSWQTRNRILTRNGPLWLPVPLRRMPLATPLREIEIQDRPDWRGRHLASIRQAYARHPHHEALESWLAIIADTRLMRLVDLNIALIRHAAEQLGLAPRFVRASSLDTAGARSEHVLAICRALGASVYHSPRGAADYMAEDGSFAAAGMPVVFQNYQLPVYPQYRQPEFVSQLSIVDAIANLGWAGVRRDVLGLN